jgi:hypothetical protein
LRAGGDVFAEVVLQGTAPPIRIEAVRSAKSAR